MPAAANRDVCLTKDSSDSEERNMNTLRKRLIAAGILLVPAFLSGCSEPAEFCP